MKEVVHGNLWEYPADYRCVTTNGVITNDGKQLVMGKGVALEAKRRFPQLPYTLAKYVKQYGNRAFILPEFKLISFPTKTDWRLPSDMKLIVKSALETVAIADKYNIDSIVLPAVGCGSGGLCWPNVKVMVEDIFDDRFTVVLGV